MARTIEQAEQEIVVLRDMLFRNVSALAAQIPFAPQDPEAETPFECMTATLDVLNEVRDEQVRSEDGWRGSAESRLEALRRANNMRELSVETSPTMRSLRWWEWSLVVALVVIACVYLLHFSPRWPR